MKKLEFDGTYNQPLLSEELFAAFPEWHEPDPWNSPDDRVTKVIIEGNIHFPRQPGDKSTKVILQVPDEANETAIAAIVQAHDHTKKSKNETATLNREQRLASARAKMTFPPLRLTDDEFDVLVGG